MAGERAFCKCLASQLALGWILYATKVSGTPFPPKLFLLLILKLFQIMIMKKIIRAVELRVNLINALTR